MRPLLAALLLLLAPSVTLAAIPADPVTARVPEEVYPHFGGRPGPVPPLEIASNPAAGFELPNPPLRLQSMLSSGWTPERQVFSPDGWNGYAFDAVLDAQDHPYIVFSRDDPLKSPHPLVLYWSHFDGATWSAKARVSPLDDSWASKPRVTLDSSGKLWLVWANITLRGIWYAVLDSGQWSAPARLNPSDAWSQYSPVIAQGGGEIWCTWYASTAGTNHYDVFVSRWTGSAWSSPENLTYKIPGWHWFVDLAVDSQGQPHLVWGNTDTGGLLYAMRSNSGGWTAPERINVAPANGWPFCGIALADDGKMDVMWATMTADLAYRHRSAEGQWLPEQILFQHQGYGAAYPDIAAHDGTVSVVWFEYTGVTEVIYEVEPGKEISRLDSGTWFYQETPVILAGTDSLWAFWLAADQAQTKATYLFSTRALVGSVPVLVTFAAVRRDNDGIVLEWQTSESNPGTFRVARELPGQTRERISDSIPATPNGYFFRDTSNPPVGTNYYLELRDRAGDTTTFGPYELLDILGAPSVTPQLAAMPNPFRSGVTLSARGLPPGDLSIEVCSVAGRVMHREPQIAGFGGGNAEFSIPGLDALPAGIYFVRLRAGDIIVSSRLVKLQ